MACIDLQHMAAGRFRLGGAAQHVHDGAAIGVDIDIVVIAGRGFQNQIAGLRQASAHVGDLRQ